MSKAIRDIAFIQVLRIKDFRNLWLSQLISQVFINLLFFSLMIRSYELTSSNSAVSVLVFLVALPNILVGALAGVLVDRLGRKSVMFFCHFIRVFAVLAFFISGETLGWIYAMTFLISIITQFFFPAEAATIHEVVKDKRLLLAANGFFSLTFFGSVIVGNVLAGPILASFGPKVTFLTVSFAFLLASFFTSQLPGDLMLHLENLSGKLRERNLFSDFLVGLDHIYKTPAVQKGIFAMGASQITIGILGAIAPGFADKILHLPVTDVSIWVMAPAALGMVLGAIIISQFFRRMTRETLISSGFTGASLALIVYSLVDKVSGLFGLPLLGVNALLLIFLGISNAMLDVPVNTMIQENTPEEIRSRVYGVDSTVIGLASMFPIVLAGALADAVGVRMVMLISGAGLLLAGLFIRSKFKEDVNNSL